jgi:hypothetical protein
MEKHYNTLRASSQAQIWRLYVVMTTRVLRFTFYASCYQKRQTQNVKIEAGLYPSDGGVWLDLKADVPV